MTTKASKKADEEVKDDQKEKQLYSFLFVLIGLTLWTRFHKISQPPWVCWDETHFGKLNVLPKLLNYMFTAPPCLYHYRKNG